MDFQEDLEAALRQQVRRDKDERLRSATHDATAFSSNSRTPASHTPTGNSQPPSSAQPPPANPPTAPASPHTPSTSNPRPPGITQNSLNSPQSPSSPTSLPQQRTTTTPKEGSRLYHSNLKKTALNSLPAQEKRGWNVSLYSQVTQ